MRIVDLRAGLNFSEIDALLAADDFDRGTEKTVHDILEDVKQRGDEAVCEYTRRFDEFDITPDLMHVPEQHIREYAAGADDELVDILRKAIHNIRDFHEQQIEESWEYYAGDGVRLGLRVTPIESLGIYVPGGKAYPSSVLMNAIPAQIAGVERIVVVTPPRSLEENPLVAAALDLLKLRDVYRIGGAQAIGALAYGTNTIPRVKKIVGPGNPHVQAAKRQVYGTVEIDLISTSSEVAIVADETCDASWIAADLLAQAEHDETTAVWLVCWSNQLAAEVFEELQVQLQMLDRGSIARIAIVNKGMTFVVPSENDAIDFINHTGPKNVEVLMAEPEHVADNIKSAGNVFIGRYAPSVVGEYFAGPSHLRVADFLKRSNLIRYSGRAIERFGEMIEKFAIAEGLTGHARSVSIRRIKPV